MKKIFFLLIAIIIVGCSMPNQPKEEEHKSKKRQPREIFSIKNDSVKVNSNKWSIYEKDN